MEKRFPALKILIAVALGIALSSIGSPATAGHLYVYRQKDGTRWITDHWMPPQEYAYIGKYGRPTAVLSCIGLKPAALEARAANYQPLIASYAEAYKVDPALVKAVIRVESCFDRNAVSSVGAQGLMQLMPFTAQDLGVSDSFDPEQNIRGGVQYLGQMLNKFSQDWQLALAAYNAGPNTVERYSGVPPLQETQAYVTKVMAHYKSYSENETTQ